MNRPTLFLRTVLCTAAFGIGLSAALDGARGAEWWEKGKELLKRGGSDGATSSALSTGEIAAGLKQALEVGTENVVAQLGQAGGFSNDPKIHIPLPDSLSGVQSALSRVGMSPMLDDLELRLNEAAEVATPRARSLFTQAIRQMTLEDVQAIYRGPEDAATRYFQSKMSAPLAAEMTPIVQSSLAQVGAVKSYDAAMGQYQALPFVPDAKANLSSYVVEKGMDGIFYYLAQQEAAIRQDPARRTTELLRTVFGAGSN